jgi:hypothetical protein
MHEASVLAPDHPSELEAERAALTVMAGKAVIAEAPLAAMPGMSDAFHIGIALLRAGGRR